LKIKALKKENILTCLLLVFLLTEAGWDAGGSPQIPLVFTLLVSQVLLLIGIDICSGPLLIEMTVLIRSLC
jgi:hypothetical protein